VPEALRPRLDFAVQQLVRAGFEVVVGDCTGNGDGVVSAPAPQRAAELTAMLTDPSIAAVVPPWGGELAVDLLPHLDFDALAAAPPTWLVGCSDISTLLLPLTLLTATATLHAENLMDTPYRLPAGLASWLDVASAEPGATITQRAAGRHRSGGFDDWTADPTVTERALTGAGTWTLLDPGGGPVHARGRLIGGCLETVSLLAGTRYGDLPGFAAAHAPDGLIVYVEAAEHRAFDVARDLWRLRLAGWFDTATAVLVGRPAPRTPRGCPSGRRWRACSATSASRSCWTSTSATCLPSWPSSTARAPSSPWTGPRRS
jgi:muramoyltetrapeptide carboxypeptidase LdcA involved in peptidoglycan recycling